MTSLPTLTTALDKYCSSTDSTVLFYWLYTLSFLCCSVISAWLLMDLEQKPFQWKNSHFLLTPCCIVWPQRWLCSLHQEPHLEIWQEIWFSLELFLCCLWFLEFIKNRARMSPAVSQTHRRSCLAVSWANFSLCCVLHSPCLQKEQRPPSTQGASCFHFHHLGSGRELGGFLYFMSFLGGGP